MGRGVLEWAVFLLICCGVLCVVLCVLCAACGVGRVRRDAGNFPSTGSTLEEELWPQAGLSRRPRGCWPHALAI